MKPRLYDDLLILMVSGQWASGSIETRAALIMDLVTPRGRMVKPTASEVQTYSDSIHAGINGQEFIDHYDANGWMVGKVPMKNWQAAVRTWKIKRTDMPRKPRIMPLQQCVSEASNEEMF